MMVSISFCEIGCPPLGSLSPQPEPPAPQEPGDCDHSGGPEKKSFSFMLAFWSSENMADWAGLPLKTSTP
jgi:hypothetical protein